MAPNNQVSYQLLSQHGNIKSWCPQVEGKRTSASTYHLLSHFMMASPPISRLWLHVQAATIRLSQCHVQKLQGGTTVQTCRDHSQKAVAGHSTNCTCCAWDDPAQVLSHHENSVPWPTPEASRELQS